MAVKIRLTRGGRKKRPFYRVIVTDVRNARDSEYIEKLGTFDPIKKEFIVNEEKVSYWLNQGALLSDTVRRNLAQKGLVSEVKRESSQQGIAKKDREKKSDD